MTKRIAQKKFTPVEEVHESDSEEFDDDDAEFDDEDGEFEDEDSDDEPVSDLEEDGDFDEDELNEELFWAKATASGLVPCGFLVPTCTVTVKDLPSKDRKQKHERDRE